MHVPKCGGVSVSKILKQWFGDRYVRPSKEGFHSLVGDQRFIGGPSCIHEHFSAYEDHLNRVYPNAQQLFTILRDPFDMLLSLYTYGLRRDGPSLAKESGSLDRFLDRLLERRGTASLFTWLPRRAIEEPLAEYANRFLLIGVTDQLQESMTLLANVIGMPVLQVPRANVSREDGVFSDRRNEFRKFLLEEYALYEMACGAISCGEPLGWAHPKNPES